MDTDCSFLDYSFINFGNTESLLTTSQYAKVIFHNVLEKYDLNADLICQYSLTEHFVAKSGDRIVLFRLGWQQVTDYVLFEWATVPENSCALQVKFKACSLPRDTNEFYQLCYISGENAVCGASIPFQFHGIEENLVTSTDSEYFISIQMESLKTVASTSGVSSQSESIEADTTTKLSVKDSEVNDLKEENKKLQNEIQKTNESVQNCDGQINELKNEIGCLKQMLQVTQNDVSVLKIRMDIANEEYKKMYIEKSRIEKKYEKLVKKCQNKTRNKSVGPSENDASDFIGELEPLPPFPLLM